MAKTVILGNDSPVEPQKVDPKKSDVKRVKIDGPAETVMSFPDDMGIAEILHTITTTWLAHHSDEDPAWVESNDPLLEEVIADSFEGTSAGRKKSWKGKSVLMPLEGGGVDIYHDDFFAHLITGITRNARYLRTDAGKDFQSRVMGDTASTGTGSYAAATYIALTANATAPAAGDTTLTGEIVTGGGGLIRAQAAYAHTAGASTYTLTKTFTVNGSDSIPVTVAKIGVFNASSSGTMVFETLLSSTAPLSAIGDQVQVTETVTI